MAARTTTGDGNVSNATGTSLNGGTALGTTDTLTDTHNIHFNANTQFGSSPNTGGTAALAVPNSVAGKTVTIDAGITLTSKGDFNIQGAVAPYYNTLDLEAGSTLTFLPPSGQQYKLYSTNYVGIVTVNGTLNSPVTIKTDLSLSGLPAYFFPDGAYAGGLNNASYLQATDLGDSTHYGLSLKGDDTTIIPAVSHTNLTLTRTSLFVDMASTWDGDYTCEDVVLSDTTTIDESQHGNCALFRFENLSATGTFLWNRNYFDATVNQTYCIEPTITNSFYGNGIYFGAGGGTVSWSTNDQFAQNIIVSDFNTMTFFGPVRDMIFVHTLHETGNPHFTAGAVDFLRVALEYDDVGSSAGDGLHYPTSATHCLILPGADGYAACYLVVGPGTVNNNTVNLRGTETGQQNLGEQFDTTLGAVPSNRSNFCFSTDATTYCYALRFFGAHTQAVDTVTNAGFNVFFNPNSGTNYYNTVTSQANVVGYDGLIVSVNSPFPNSKVGHDDVTLTGLPFVDTTLRSFRKWGQVVHGTDGTLAAAAAKVKEDRTRIYTAGADSAIQWVFAGYAPTGANGLLIKDNGFDGATRGAVEYVASSTGGDPLGIQSLFGNIFGDLEPVIAAGRRAG